MIERPDRRRALLGILAAPFIVRASSLMPVKALILPEELVWMHATAGFTIVFRVLSPPTDIDGTRVATAEMRMLEAAAT